MYRNLEYREADGGRIRVSLDWDDETNTVLLTAEDVLGDRIEAVVPSTHSAHQAFLHPFAYADDLVGLPTGRRLGSSKPPGSMGPLAARRD